jgi:radical SAM superfamily enzyme YgiQ (UPF0313 family)
MTTESTESPLRILLVMPTPFENGRLGLENVIWLSEPVGLTAIAAAVPRCHELRVLDLRLEDEDALGRELAEFRPHLVGTTSMTTDAYQAKAVLRMARSMCPDALTVVGGHHPTLCPEEFEQPFVDAIVQGEGEHTFQELVSRWGAQHAAGDRKRHQRPRGSRPTASAPSPALRLADPGGSEDPLRYLPESAHAPGIGS